MPETDTTDDVDAADSGEDYSHLFRNEGFVSDVDLRVDVADNYLRYVAGDDDIEIDVDETEVDATVTVVRGARTRHVGSYKKKVGGEEMLAVGESVEETVHGGVHVMARFASEAMVGGAYTNIVAGPYLRIAAWVDFLVWGGWAEVDVVRAELSALMIRSHVGYAHAAGVRVTLASRLVDDFQSRTETFGMLADSTAVHNIAGAPGGGVTNEA